MKQNIDIVIFHGHCADGFGAAIVAKKHYPNAIFHPGFHGDNPPENIEGKDILIADFSYKRNVLIQMASKAKSILILDHHKSAEADLKDLPCENVTTIFDMNRSGAMITWDYLNPGLEAPMIIKHIQDRDLWRFAIEGTKEISAALFSYEYDLDAWTAFIDFDLSEMLIAEGRTLVRKQDKDVKEMISKYGHEMEIYGQRVPAMNTSYFYSSDVGSEMAKGKPFAACYFMDSNWVYFSLRSNNEGMDVSVIASYYGGGGHRNASGFKISRTGPEWKQMNDSSYETDKC